ncbi:VOC family protein [Herbiconiux sp. VKM Ac-1786]|uniref:VOC family protein n=1 Tax=Herbiconiux sp. VKM Ac-1786 TaxID=2783824 RepID=UPI00188A20D6|nr:VOC family protein [Herbiconiux sp. VKM Ac-1786]MBF4573272.1 VOC family protein [Herbiconiux sp. VKM Ac-1786]
MLTTSHGFSGFSVTDVDESRRFYQDVLGLEVSMNEMGILDIALPANGAHVLAYPKQDHVPAVFTILNFAVDDIDRAIDELEAAGVSLERYEGMPQDERGVMRGKAAGQGPDIAWFLDPSGNILSILSD